MWTTHWLNDTLKDFKRECELAFESLLCRLTGNGEEPAIELPGKYVQMGKDTEFAQALAPAQMFSSGDVGRTTRISYT